MQLWGTYLYGGVEAGGLTESVASLLWKHRFTNAVHPFLFTLSRSAWISFCHLFAPPDVDHPGKWHGRVFQHEQRENVQEGVWKNRNKKNRTSVSLFLAWFYLSLVRLPELAWNLSRNGTWEKSSNVDLKIVTHASQEARGNALRLLCSRWFQGCPEPAGQMCFLPKSLFWFNL